VSRQSQERVSPKVVGIAIVLTSPFAAWFCTFPARSMGQLGGMALLAGIIGCGILMGKQGCDDWIDDE
jgi:UDP-N-acetylmuramyl pentapeptide phosphotransferase/UDP-N-acetylglucosamine-1-phosphate transferase